MLNINKKTQFIVGGGFAGLLTAAYLFRNPSRAYATGQNQGTGCSPDANPGGNSAGWYTEGANSSGGSGWTGKAGHHHCDWKKQCCFCTDVPKCIKSGTPPTQPGSCRPDWGTKSYLGGGSYPTSADFSKCPAGTGPDGGGGGGTTAVSTPSAPVVSASTPTPAAGTGFDLSSITGPLGTIWSQHSTAIIAIVALLIFMPMIKKAV